MNRLVLARMEYKGKPVIAAALCRERKVYRIRLLSLENNGLLGNIYLGKVKNIVKNIQAAFIEIADGIMCYLPMEGENTDLRAGDELAVQVCRESMKNKLPSVSTNLNFTGRYLVLTTGRKELGFSRKISAEEKERIRSLLEKEMPKETGVIVRTDCKNASDEEIRKELQFLKGRMEKVVHKAKTRTCFSLLEENIPEYLREVQDTCGQDLTEIVTDEKQLFDLVGEYLQHFQKQINLRFYEDKLLPLFKLYSLETVLEEAAGEKVWLQSGGFLVIQQTEAFAAVDVNTGKCSGKKEQEETYYQMNLEAAKEIARQIRLRNLSGIILIDFINMKSKEKQRELMRVLQGYLNQDEVKASVVDMTALNIVEVTRKKVRRPLLEEMKELCS